MSLQPSDIVIVVEPVVEEVVRHNDVQPVCSMKLRALTDNEYHEGIRSSIKCIKNVNIDRFE